jgi:predicted ATPase
MGGYPDRALQRSREAVTQARDLSHPFTLSLVLNWAVWLCPLRREPQAAATRAEAMMAHSTEQGFAQWAALGRVLQGWALAEQAQAEEGIVDIRQGLIAYQAMGAAVGRPHYLALLAEAYGRTGMVEAGLTALTEALILEAKTRERVYEAELYRLRGELWLARLAEPDPEAEICFQHALGVTRRQHAKSLELRAAMGLSHLWQRQATRIEARQLLAAVYNWFTEGFETVDL